MFRFPFRKKRNKQIPVILLHGKIFNGDEMLNMQIKRPVIDAAFDASKDVVFLSINSPGGLPGQSQLLHDYIRLKAAEKSIKVISFIEDFGASGGYWLAMAGDEIYCLDTSFVGSIGVVSAGFGLQDFIKNYSIERRLMTAGEAKVREDMFSEFSEEDKAYKKDLLEQLHRVFKQKVSERRPNINTEIFDARTVIGEKALELGLVDGINNMFAYAEERYAGRQCRYYSERKLFIMNRLRRLFNFGFMEESTPQLRMP